MLNNCTGLKNFDGKQDFVKKKICCFLFEKRSKTEKRVKTENANKTAFATTATGTFLERNVYLHEDDKDEYYKGNALEEEEESLEAPLN